ncbi:MAG: GNAT family N-acetyltransferase [Flavobacteriaceae bacterium]
MDGIEIVELDGEGFERHAEGLSELLCACVNAGASISFVLPHDIADSRAFWRRKVLPPLSAGGLALFAALSGGRVVGSVQLDHDTPQNQPHRAEVRKLLVHPDFRRRGIARLLMAALEARALALGRSLITLDTRTGDDAEPLYRSMDYEVAGVIPDFCRDTVTPCLDPTTIMYKRLRRPVEGA